MPKTKEQKQKIIEDLKEKFAKQKSIILVDFEGLDSKALFQLRNELKQSNCLFKVVKKTLLKKVLEGLKEKNLIEKLEQIQGQLALAFGPAPLEAEPLTGCKDELSPAKICYQFQKDNEKLEILGGILNREFLEKERVIELAQIPSRPELLARLVGSLQSTISNFVYVLKGNIKGLIFALNAISNQ